MRMFSTSSNNNENFPELVESSWKMIPNFWVNVLGFMCADKVKTLAPVVSNKIQYLVKESALS